MADASKVAWMVYPHQLFDPKHLGSVPGPLFLIEDGLFFGDHVQGWTPHKQNLWLHRSSMKRYAQELAPICKDIEYRDHLPGQDMTALVLEDIAKRGHQAVACFDPHDYLLKRRLERHAAQHNLDVHWHDAPMFLNTTAMNSAYREEKSRWFMADYYKFQRRRLNVLMEGEEPAGGQWSFDEDNRKKVPKAMLSEIPELPAVDFGEIEEEARKHVEKITSRAPGNLNHLWYPTTREQASVWLQRFLDERFNLFGPYEDAIVKNENWLWHSVLTPSLNIGLLTPEFVVEEAIAYAEKNDVPLNSLEGFVRQIVGWREFMRATYEDLGVKMRTTNHWGHTRSIPASFYEGTTGIGPIDDTIHRILDTGYCHHIERLMVLGGFMFLCEFDPDEIYRWFMEMFVDSYDWVMVPNVYAMSQNADGGLITTKPYFSGSAYVKKMSNHPTGPWTQTWDGLYWRWIDDHRESLAKNPRWSMMCAMCKKMDPEKLSAHRQAADAFLAQL